MSPTPRGRKTGNAPDRSPQRPKNGCGQRRENSDYQADPEEGIYKSRLRRRSSRTSAASGRLGGKSKPSPASNDTRDDDDERRQQPKIDQERRQRQRRGPPHAHAWPSRRAGSSRRPQRDKHQYHRGHDDDERQARRARPIERDQHLVIDLLADDAHARATHQRGRHEGADRDAEDQKRARDQAGQAQRKDDSPEHRYQLAPRLVAASSRLGGMRSIAAISGSTMNGMKILTRPITTAVSV